VLGTMGSTHVARVQAACGHSLGPGGGRRVKRGRISGTVRAEASAMDRVSYDEPLTRLFRAAAATLTLSFLVGGMAYEGGFRPFQYALSDLGAALTKGGAQTATQRSCGPSGLASRAPSS
jgi:hypothetical protein